ncbi:MAG: alpha-ketoglutarate-dependent dioxygenase AlkB family protein [Flavobacteriales bacterium]|jgi:alkylated DNA repair dioxygenase AlkB
MTEIVLHSDGLQRLEYYPDFFTTSYFDRLAGELPWQQNEIRVFGKTHLEPRLTCWFGPAYRYSSIQWPEAPLPDLINEIRSQLHSATDFSFNAVLANFYRNGNDSMGWHSDNEPEIDQQLIASVTFGGKRVFKFRRKSDQKVVDIELLDRSLLLMHHMQQDWQHALPKSKTRMSPRINLTFRSIV